MRTKLRSRRNVSLCLTFAAAYLLITSATREASGIKVREIVNGIRQEADRGRKHRLYVMPYVEGVMRFRRHTVSFFS
jgi:hypothetical protein